jgi:hypothetical protein
LESNGHARHNVVAGTDAPEPKQTSDNAVAFFSFWSPSELSRIRFEPFIMRVITIEAAERRCMTNENTRRGRSAAHRRGGSRSKRQQEVAEFAAQADDGIGGSTLITQQAGQTRRSA